jgi:hypothetical protein
LHCPHDASDLSTLWPTCCLVHLLAAGLMGLHVCLSLTFVLSCTMSLRSKQSGTWSCLQMRLKASPVFPNLPHIAGFLPLSGPESPARFTKTSTLVSAAPVAPPPPCTVAGFQTSWPVSSSSRPCCPSSARMLFSEVHLLLFSSYFMWSFKHLLPFEASPTPSVGQCSFLFAPEIPTLPLLCESSPTPQSILCLH